MPLIFSLARKSKPIIFTFPKNNKQRQNPAHVLSDQLLFQFVAAQYSTFFRAVKINLGLQALFGFVGRCLLHNRLHQTGTALISGGPDL
jgi:hypothetical protein